MFFETDSIWKSCFSKSAVKIFISESVLEILIPKFVKISFTRVTPKHLDVALILKTILEDIFFTIVMQRHINFV